jgi:hypothetical protein
MKDYSNFTLKTLTFDNVPDTFQLSSIAPRVQFFLLGDRMEKELDDIGLTLLLAIELYKEDGDRDDLRSLFRIANVQRDFGAWVAAPGWSWEEGFALFALLKVAEALPYLEREPSIAAECALEAMEAVCYAELLKFLKETKNKQEKDPERQFQTQLASYHSTLGKKAANARHDRTTRPLKAKAIELYESKKWPSVRQAAKYIYRELKQDKSMPTRLSPERGEKTIYDWLLAHRKKTISASS